MEYFDENRYLSCAFKHTNDFRSKSLSNIDDIDGEIKIALTILQEIMLTSRVVESHWDINSYSSGTPD